MFRVFNKIKPTIFNATNKKDLWLSQLANLTSAGLNIVTPFIFASLINSAASENQEISVLGINVNTYEMATVYCAIITAGQVVGVLRKKTVHRVISNSALDVQEMSITHLMYQSYNYHVTVSPGEKNELLAISTYSTPDYDAQLIGQMIPTAIETAVSAGLLSWLYGWTPGVVLTGTLVISGVYNSLFGNKLAKLQHEFLTDRTMLSRQSMATLTNYETIQMFNNSNYELGRIRSTLNKMAVSCANVLSYPDTVGIGQRLLTAAGFTGLIMHTIKQIQSNPNHYSPKDLITIAYYLAQYANQLNAFCDGMVKLKAASASLTKVVDFLETQTEVPDTYKNDHLVVDAMDVSVEFKRVNFSYPDGKQALKNVSFEIPAGKQTAIVGPSGAGKSSIAKLLYRFFDIQSGEIQINKENINEYSIKSVRALLSIVPQDAVMFNTTLLNNIWYGAISKRGPEPDMKAVNDALEQTNLVTFVQGLKRGLNTVVGERALKMSGGQKGRLAIARALVRKPKIYIFDEATTGLDSSNENEIQDKINTVTEGCTTIVITHRLANIVNAEKIIVMNEGQVAEQGTHAILMEKNGLYASLWHQQSESKEKAVPDLLDFSLLDEPNISNQTSAINVDQDSKSIFTSFDLLNDSVANNKSTVFGQRRTADTNDNPFDHLLNINDAGNNFRN